MTNIVFEATVTNFKFRSWLGSIEYEILCSYSLPLLKDPIKIEWQCLKKSNEFRELSHRLGTLVDASSKKSLELSKSSLFTVRTSTYAARQK
jgi:hypothetical protein